MAKKINAYKTKNSVSHQPTMMFEPATEIEVVLANMGKAVDASHEFHSNQRSDIAQELFNLANAIAHVTLKNWGESG